MRRTAKGSVVTSILYYPLRRIGGENGIERMRGKGDAAIVFVADDVLLQAKMHSQVATMINIETD